MAKYSDKKRTAVFDTECFHNYWAIAFRDVESGRIRTFERYERHPLDVEAVKKILKKWRVVSFNGISYDMPMIALALSGATNSELKTASDMIIQTNLKPWEFRDAYGVSVPGYTDHIDLIEVAPGDGSLKAYGGRVHTKRMMDMPVHHDAWLTDEERAEVKIYLENDLANTLDLYNELAEQLSLRCSMSDEYGIDLRSKSDAQMAEAIMKNEVEKHLNRRVEKPVIRPGIFRYDIPDFIKFETQGMRDILEIIAHTKFVVGYNGRIDLPEALANLNIEIDGMQYNMGIGGLHSTESKISHFSDEDYILLDRDVTSFYPWIILILRIIPASMGGVFLKVFRSILDRRVEAKEKYKISKDAFIKAVAEVLKIVLNGTFGKLGSPYSIFYTPKGMIQTTITGQLVILMQIERVSLAGFKVVSANTDGFVTMVPRDKRALFTSVIFDWENDTGFMTEETEYKSLHSKDVNNYIAVPYKGEAKRKGLYAKSGPGVPGAMGLKKNPTCEIVPDAVSRFLTDAVPVEETIRASRDIRAFVAIRKVDGGARYKGEVIGKNVRWYYSSASSEPMYSVKSGNLVPKTQGSVPVLMLPDEFPDDVDYDWYIREAYGVLEDLGMGRYDPTYQGRSGYVFGRLPGQKTVHVINLQTGVALCERATKDVRDPWIEYGEVPDAYKLCAKCRRGHEV